MSEAEIKEKMTKALIIAKEAWIDANMPKIIERDINYYPEEIGKIALAMLATKIFDNLGESK